MKANKKNKIKVTSRAGRKEERTAYLCLIPAFLGVSLISYLPTLAVFVLSVFKWNGLSSPEFVGLENFQRIFTKDIYFADSIKATILYALLAVVGAIIIRMDKGDEIISTILGICQKEQIASAIFSGIGGCKSDNFVRSSGCGRRYYLFSSGSPAFEYENMGTDIIPFCFLHSIPFACNRCLQRMAMVI